MVTGDLNAALVEWVVQYRIDDPKQYLFDVRNPAQTLRDVSEAAMREVIGDRTVDEVITIGRQDIEIAALARMQELAKRYKLGIRVDQVQLKNVNPPAEVQASFNEVNKAQQDRENVINIANGDYNEAVPKARGQADQVIRGAEGYRFKRVNEARRRCRIVQRHARAIHQSAGNHADASLSRNDERRCCRNPDQKSSSTIRCSNLLPILPLTGKPVEVK